MSPSTELKYTVTADEEELQFDENTVGLPPIFRMASLKDEGGLLRGGAALGVVDDISKR